MESLLIFLAVLVSSVAAFVPGKLKVDCGAYPNKPATLHFSGDAKAVFAFADIGQVCRFKETDVTGDFTLTVGYKKGDSCKFIQSAPDRDNFVINVETRTLHEKVEGADDERFIVACNYMRFAEVELKYEIVSQYKPPLMQLYNKAKKAKSVFTVYLTNIMGNALTGAVAEKRIVKMRAKMSPAKSDGSASEVGFQPVQCVAEPDKGGRQLVILSDGCGTGFPWTKKQGFTMNGLIGDSPNFRLFRLDKRQGIKISCDFVVCTKPCNENSCAAARKTVIKNKRSIRNPDAVPSYLSGTLDLLISPGNKSTSSEKIQSDESVALKKSIVFDVESPIKERSTLYYDSHKATFFSAIFIASSIVLVSTIILTTFILSKIHQTHNLILKCKMAS
ncbi:uncharacterized protein LOC126828637 [Patella vulgata]|uniref:uncharacterized protein LOC126828637 n=1 Tax=Patella vulgata TaxID=6465 RepID=UPI00217FE4C0|nr:uncharacterized protein LOC126828637 [Patella vulgata]